MKGNNAKLGDLLLYVGKITKEQLNEAISEQKNSDKKIGEILVEKGWVSEKDIIEVLEFQLGIPHVDLDRYLINSEVSRLIPENLARRYDLIAVDKKNDYLIVAMADPLNIFAIDDVRLTTGFNVQPVISTKKDIERAIDKYYEKERTKRVLEEFKENYIPNDETIEENQEEINSAPVVKLLNSMIAQAVNMRASDVHIEPFNDNVRVRFRIDGDLQEIMNLSRNTISAIITRIKIMGKMNIAERRIPQDGRVEINVDGRDIDLRISTLPTIYGEKIVLRILDRGSFLFTKKDLGFTEEDFISFENILNQPYGMILVTGPTGSGKTTTLYTILSELNSIEKNIITVEDPVEYKFSGINQVQVNNKAGLTFANGLRSILRQDPDIIMLGEIRDGETAKMAVRAAITGHLVFSTLHTNDTASSITRLVDMGIEPYLVSSAVIGIISQRLIKKLCPFCKTPYETSYREKKILGLDTEKDMVFYKPNMCNLCNKGYKGRTAVHEVMPIDEDIRRGIDRRESADYIKNLAIEKGMKTLFQNAVRLVESGTITMEEALKVGYTL
ncbi:MULTISPECIES: GspE/PulE family protein [Tissierellales]|jgi:type IV pilus assembly protein PilB|uniref:Type II/IV secretion system protein n=1 Tax=Acidilutibacter cellobiosedens TaxID=2507161 RepID=A0A410QCY6_9FIRM|nr:MULTISPECIES: GspE/PulE family protein [Tissierellales]MBE6082569.1 type II/IV secretion system protein [Tissierellaceae bacterium]QAT61789.1 type II/IV secretion system protein [Acidilutibacter cellobiosedens]SCL82225.1 Type II traffic warden ATPase [Sporanaerobacter sp. PP17-6a]